MIFLKSITFFFFTDKPGKKPRHRKTRRLCKNIMQDCSLIKIVHYYEYLNHVSSPQKSQQTKSQQPKKQQQKQKSQQKSQQASNPKKKLPDRDRPRKKKNGSNKTSRFLGKITKNDQDA